MSQNPGPAKPGRSTPEIVRVARDLNRSGLWTIYRRGPGGSWRPSEKVEAVTLSGVRWFVSASTLARIRTPKGERTESGAAGLGKRTVCAYAVGAIVGTPHAVASRLLARPERDTIRFNPFRADVFTLGDGLQPAPEGLTLAFIHDGRVEVVA